MELWIRNQDREVLTKVDDIHIGEYNGIYTDTHKICLGTYETRKRALEVLDEIQNILMPKIDISKLNGQELQRLLTIWKLTTPEAYEITKNDVYVYEMPKE